MEANQGVLADKLGIFSDLKTEKKRLADETKENNAAIEQTEKEIIGLILDMAEASGIDDPTAFKVKMGGREYGVTTKTYYNIKAEDRDVAFAKLRELGLGDLIVQTIDRRTLTSQLAQIMDEHGGELPEEYAAIPMSEHSESKISDRKAGR